MKEKRSIHTSSVITKVFGALWVLSIVVFVTSLLVATNLFREMIGSTSFGSSDIFLLLFIGSFAIGSISFLVMVVSLVSRLFVNKKTVKSKKTLLGILLFPFKYLLILSILPLYLIYKLSGISKLFNKEGSAQTAQPNTRLSRIISIIIVLLTLVPMWVCGYAVIGNLAIAGLGYSPEAINIVGTGSMYPTWPTFEGTVYRKTPFNFWRNFSS